MGECKHAQKYILMYADMHALRLRCKFSEGTKPISVSLKQLCAHTHTHSVLSEYLRRKIESQALMCLCPHTRLSILHFISASLISIHIPYVCVCVCVSLVCV